ncbi:MULTISPECIES: amino acid aminotransferase [Burkholderia]|uniref:Aromatic amino acid aminotransferase n=1 Tax=Burkholderia savannae TaxID=1637837 RepID=A0ABR5T7A1_9BURK|nr:MULTISPECIES: amino acid aminotransferase [Burkholderia]AOJ82867.1 aromatic amino acid aminotransferase [Burkholderia savannae]AOK50887.1 aromatic amino acid aminotransferase [Burkholderia sp. MSMB617WGS]KGR93002.1 aminotransferase class I and II family protein [Burkholderia sp. ABCPW 111]KVK90073.1 aromatic amino acid aminotransferase [Burkholderia sp. MSMB1498]KWZ39112.1 aromatic amino acid aminotransferase [Burkholderia savannae]
MFEHIHAYPGDPILSLFQAFQRDPEPRKVNLSIGLYYDESGAVPVLDSVRAAAARLSERHDAHTYLPMEGMADYRRALQSLLFGAGSTALRDKRIATVQTVGGSGALRLGADLLKRYFPDSAIWIGDPTWDNHRVLFAAAGLDVHTYPYYDAATNGIRFDAMTATLDTLPARAIVLLQPCCHNPTGIDLSREQWRELAALCGRRGLIPFLDIAYQGFGDSLDDDAWPIRAMTDAGLPVFVSHSFSKNFSLYGERCGGLSIACANESEAARVLSQIQAGVRRIYSSPPLHGARLISTVLNDAALAQQWARDVAAMRERIKRMRSALAARLAALVPGASFDYLVEQRGMFSYTGLAPAEVDALRERDGVYLLRSGRACIAGLSDANVDHVANAIAGVLKTRRARVAA